MAENILPCINQSWRDAAQNNHARRNMKQSLGHTPGKSFTRLKISTMRFSTRTRAMTGIMHDARLHETFPTLYASLSLIDRVRSVHNVIRPMAPQTPNKQSCMVDSVRRSSREVRHRNGGGFVGQFAGLFRFSGIVGNASTEIVALHQKKFSWITFKKMQIDQSWTITSFLR